MKRIVSIVFVVLACAVSASAQTQNCLLTTCPDTFNGTNTNVLSTYDATQFAAGASCCNEAAIRGTPGVGISSSRSLDKVIGHTWTDDHWVELKTDGTNIADTFGICVRWTGDGGTAGNGYCAGKDSGNFGDRIDIWKVTNNVVLSLANDAHVLTTNETYNFQVVGNALTLKLNGSTLLSTTDSTFGSGGGPAMVFETGTATNRLAGTLKAGSVTTTTTRPCIIGGGLICDDTDRR